MMIVHTFKDGRLRISHSLIQKTQANSPQNTSKHVHCNIQRTHTHARMYWTSFRQNASAAVLPFCAIFDFWFSLLLLLLFILPFLVLYCVRRLLWRLRLRCMYLVISLFRRKNPNHFNVIVWKFFFYYYYYYFKSIKYG